MMHWRKGEKREGGIIIFTQQPTRHMPLQQFLILPRWPQRKMLYQYKRERGGDATRDEDEDARTTSTSFLTQQPTIWLEGVPQSSRVKFFEPRDIDRGIDPLSHAQLRAKSFSVGDDGGGGRGREKLLGIDCTQIPINWNCQKY